MTILEKINKELNTNYNKLNDNIWNDISETQELSEKFIEKHSNKVNWNYISYKQQLSEEFIEKYNIKNYNLLNIIHNCGDNNRTIYITKDKSKIINIGCFSGTKKEAIKVIKEKYGNTKICKEYINNVKKCFNDIKVDINKDINKDR